MTKCFSNHHDNIASLLKILYKGQLRPNSSKKYNIAITTTTASTNNNNNNNNRICIAQVCRMTSEALDGQLQSCYTARARPKCPTEEKCFRLCSNRARELQHKVSVFREFQTQCSMNILCRHRDYDRDSHGLAHQALCKSTNRSHEVL